MGLFEEAKKLSRRPILPEIVKGKLDDKEYKEFVQAMKDPTISSTAIVSVLKTRGIQSSGAAVRRWRTEYDFGK